MIHYWIILPLCNWLQTIYIRNQWSTKRLRGQWTTQMEMVMFRRSPTCRGHAWTCFVARVFNALTSFWGLKSCNMRTSSTMRSSFHMNTGLASTLILLLSISSGGFLPFCFLLSAGPTFVPCIAFPSFSLQKAKS